MIKGAGFSAPDELSVTRHELRLCLMNWGKSPMRSRGGSVLWCGKTPLPRFAPDTLPLHPSVGRRGVKKLLSSMHFAKNAIHDALCASIHGEANSCNVSCNSWAVKKLAFRKQPLSLKKHIFYMPLSSFYAGLNLLFGCLQRGHFQSSGRSSNATPSCSAGSYT